MIEPKTEQGTETSIVSEAIANNIHAYREIPAARYFAKLALSIEEELNAAKAKIDLRDQELIHTNRELKAAKAEVEGFFNQCINELAIVGFHGCDKKTVIRAAIQTDQIKIQEANKELNTLRDQLAEALTENELERKKMQYASIETSFANHRLEWAIQRPQIFASLVHANAGGLAQDENARTIRAIDDYMKAHP